jgi:hypothetical protein
MEKLYRRNPREWRKGNYPSADAAVARAFDARSEFRFAELGNVRGSDAIVLALKPDYAGDRVFAFGVGLASMVFLSYNRKDGVLSHGQPRAAKTLQLRTEHRDRGVEAGQ